jgi:hypothetical protein
MKRCGLLVAIVLAACTGPSSNAPARDDEGLVSRVRAEWEFMLLVHEENESLSPEHRAALREMQRSEGLRVCEEGEHGTSWREDCKVCQCIVGRRSCPPVRCTHNSKVRETGW